MSVYLAQDFYLPNILQLVKTGVNAVDCKWLVANKREARESFIDKLNELLNYTYFSYLVTLFIPYPATIKPKFV